ncbi:putative mitochondrial protein AtMg01250 [Silene latifolia]|uniref:putative mitochondrial protein AtMg01250 n=1 Tax=Silene latifolia TaxID=37657 RepID=UPI003D771D90
MVKWILQCVTTTSFTLSLNGSNFGYFKGKRGLRQGDPMSPLLFTICLEYLTRILDVVTARHDYRFHPLYRALKLGHLAFADDLLLFCKGDVSSVKIPMRAFLTVSEASGLKVNQDKSNLYMNGVGSHVTAQISRMSGFQRGTLLFRYLGISISHKRLSNAECSKLVDKIVAKIRGWGTKHLSYAGSLF